MNATPVSPVTARSANAAKVLVWDLPTRLFHWSLVICFAGAWLTSDSERQQWLHFLFGYSLFGLIGFRIVWGFIGSRYARFGSFLNGPGATVRYLRSMAKGQPEHHVGHNPAGAIAVWLLLGLGLAVAITGWKMVAGGAGEALEDIHETLATAMLVVVGMHIVGAIVSSVLHRENLPRAMVTGYKSGPRPEDGITRKSGVVALLMIAALVAFWAYGLATRQLPFGLAGSGDLTAAGEADEHDEHDED
jgi:cytochrome b